MKAYAHKTGSGNWVINLSQVTEDDLILEIEETSEPLTKEGPTEIPRQGHIVCVNDMFVNALVTKVY